MIVKSHQKLKAWQVAMTLVNDIYALTRSFPVSERYGMSSQMQRSAVSIPANISEGAARKSSREFRRFLLMARGSLAEVETHLLIAEQQGYLNAPQLCTLLGSVNRLYGLINGLIRRHEMELQEKNGTYNPVVGSSPVSRLPSSLQA